jgi:uncharacterized phage protein gp47/JayE
MAGLDATGFTIKTLEEIREEINDELRTAYGQSVGLTDDDFLGRAVGIFAEREALLWELADAINSATDPDNATGAKLDSLAALTGTIREPAKKSTVTLTLTGTPSTTVTSGSQASVTTTLEKFTTLANATILATTAWAGTTAYALNDRVTNSGNVYLCIVAGTSAGSGGPTTEAASIVDNTVTWRFLGNGTGDDIITIETAVAGWDSVMNILDATLGSDIETDEDLRSRREEELASPGTSPIDALRTDLLLVTGVTSVTLFVNNTDTTDADGVPPHSVEALVRGGADQDIWDALLAGVAAGIGTHGTESGTSTDSEGNDHTMKFSRPTQINIYVDITCTYDVDLYPADGDDQIKAAIVAFGDAQDTGKDAVSSSIKAQCFTVPGVLDVTLAEIDTSPAPTTETTIAIALRELAVHDTSRITVASSPATP